MTGNLPQEKDWKYYLGLSLLFLSLILPLFGFFIPFFDLPVAVKTVLIGALSLGGPEILITLAVILLGKEKILYFKGKIAKFFKRKKPLKPVSRFRYYFGLLLFFGSLVPIYLNAYSPTTLPEDETTRLLILISGDLTFVISFFILGANFWEKFKRLFLYP